MSNRQAQGGAAAARASRPRPQSRLRVLQMIGFLDAFGGAERFTLGLSTSLPPDRFETWVCAPRGGDPAAVAALARAGIPFVDLGRRGKLDIHRFRGLAALLRRRRFDLVHTHLFGSNLWGTLFGRAARVPILIAHEHTWSYEGDPLRTWLDGHVIGRLTTRFVAVSTVDAERMVRLEGVPPAKVVVLPTAYIPSGPSTSTNLRAELGLEADTPLVGAVVVMRAQKALHVLLDAHARVVQAVPAAHLVLAGDGECRPALESHARALGLADRVHFLGLRRDADAITRSLDVAAMSSDYEGMPLFVFECMANRTPLVSTAVGAVQDVVQDGLTGRLVPPRDPAELARAIVELLLDPDRRARLADAAAARLDDYRMDRVAARFADFYENLAAARAGA